MKPGNEQLEQCDREDYLLFPGSHNKGVAPAT